MISGAVKVGERVTSNIVNRHTVYEVLKVAKNGVTIKPIGANLRQRDRKLLHIHSPLFDTKFTRI